MTATSRRVVIDTNLIVSRLINREGTIGRAYDLLFFSCTLLVSEATISGLRRVGLRPKIERYASLAERTETIELYAEAVEMVWIDLTVRDCRDMKDNKFLEVALCGRAELLVTGDLDLLCLHPWRGIAILSPADYLAQAG
jgi:putative PIN family toxin of toxin-antitoxin system